MNANSAASPAANTAVMSSGSFHSSESALLEEKAGRERAPDRRYGPRTPGDSKAAGREPSILIVDDEPPARKLLSDYVSKVGSLELAGVCSNGEEALKFLKENQVDILLLDIWMPDTDGITLLKEWVSSGLLTMPVVMMSGHGTIDTAVEATRMGAAAYLEKPVPLQKLLSTVGRALRSGQAKPRMTLPLASLGRGALITDLKRRLEQVASLTTPVLLISEPGTGVDLCARFLHQPNTPWVEPDTLAALSNAPFELLEQAKGGLLFLKEIGELREKLKAALDEAE